MLISIVAVMDGSGALPPMAISLIKGLLLQVFLNMFMKISRPARTCPNASTALS
jgi:hypothetical protein